jgi:uncharacterized protein YjbI with pentapeptide repeats
MERDEAINLLRGGAEGVREWNRRREVGEQIPALSEANLSEANLIGANLFRTILDEANFSRADLRGANLSLAVLCQASLIDAYVGDANLSRADLTWADLRMAKLDGTNFSRANLYEANLMDAYLEGANLTSATLMRANVSGANLYGANLNGAKLGLANFNCSNLSAANLSAANLSAANLSQANLRQANLKDAILRYAYLRICNLGGADFSGAECLGTVFANVDLSDVKGLDSVKHAGPSTIGTDTLIHSRGLVPIEFLRGCGVAEYLIENQSALIGSMQPIQFYSCFISYSGKDEEFAKRLHSKLRDQGLRIWFALADIQGGKKVHEQINEAISLHDKLLLVLSPESMGSEWVKTEISRTRKAERRENRRKLFPIRLVGFEAIRDWECFDADVGKDSAVEIREYFIPDFSNWKDHDSFEASFARLLGDLKAAGNAEQGAHPRPAPSPETPH